MPLHVRGLMFLLPVMLAGLIAFMMSGRWPIMTKERNRLVLVWLIMTSLAFTLGQYWLYVGIMFGLMIALVPREPTTRVVFFVTLIAVLPNLAVEIPGFGPIRQFLEMNHTRLMVLGLLLPLIVLPDPRGRRLTIFGSPLDKWVLLFVLVDIIALSRGIGGTEKIRLAVGHLIDFVIVYFVISRNIRTMEDLGRVFTGILFAAVVLGFVSLFESARAWKLYELTYPGLGISAGADGSFYDWRGGFLRTSGTAGYPIIFGYFFTFGLAALLAIKHHVKSGFYFWCIALLLILANFTTISRGTWLGVGVLLGIFLFLTSRGKLFALLIAVSGLMVFAASSSNPAIRDLYELLPFTGSYHDGTINYRRQLLDNAIVVMKDNLWFGSNSYLNTSELERMRQGQGIIDIVNSYLQYGLRGGVLLVGLFVMVWVSLLPRLMMTLRHVRGPARTMAAALIALNVSHLVMIFTVSSISYLPVLQWIMVAMSAAYLHIHKQVMSGQGVGQQHPHGPQGPGQGPGQGSRPRSGPRPAPGRPARPGRMQPAGGYGSLRSS